MQHSLAATTTPPFPIPFHSSKNTTTTTTTCSSSSNRLVAFTTPLNYAGRLSHLLRLKQWRPLWCPTVVVETTPQTKSSIHLHLSFANPNPNPNFTGDDEFEQKRSQLDRFSAVAFTSRTGITAFNEALTELEEPPLSPIGEEFTICALGKDSELLDQNFIDRICNNSERIRVLVPPMSTPTGLVDSLGFGTGRKVLCPVPKVVGLEEPPVVSDFLQSLASKGWVPVRVDGYETRWAGPGCAEAVAGCCGSLDAIVFTSAAEVEGMLKGLAEFGLDWAAVRGRWPELVVAAHGPVTAAGAERLGVAVDVVGGRFDSFSGVVDALHSRWQKSSQS